MIENTKRDPDLMMSLAQFRALPVSKRLSEQEEQHLSQGRHAIMAWTARAHPHQELIRVPISPENNAEVRVSSWPKSVREFDVLLAAIKASRTAFLRIGKRKTP